ncbi:MAG: type I-U CRISPR-associated protein Cas7 [Nitrospira sp.]|nr:type I-U CRISPR-associated protein Cas7 [Nitrospira sp.]
MSDEMNVQVEAYDKYIKSVDWLKDAGLPAAITLSEVLEPSEGKDAIIFPPTFAVRKAEHPYRIDTLRKDKESQAAQPGEEVNTCLIDSIGSQANRMESCFKKASLSSLVPQIEVTMKTKVNAEDRTIRVNLLDIGHRIADGAVRFFNLRDNVTEAIKAMRDNGNAEPLAKLSPTSLVFGFWDSRPETTMFKYGRLLSSTIRATNVAVVKRSAQFNPAFDPSLIGLGDEVPEGEEQSQSVDEGSGKAADGKDPLSKLGLRAAPAVDTHGGVRVYGQIIRRTEINLVNLRSLAVTKTDRDGNPQEIDPGTTLKLRRYILGLALVAARSQTHYALREGCLLIRRGDPTACVVYTDSKSKPESIEWCLEHVLKYADKTAKDFGVGAGQTIDFDVKKVREEVERLKKEGKKKSGKGSK